MKKFLYSGIMLSLLLITMLSGCGGGSTSNPPLAKYYAYVVNANDSTTAGSISAYSINADGSLKSIGTPVDTGIDPRQITVNLEGTFAYVINYKDKSISAYSINNDGTLTFINCYNEYLPSLGPTSIEVHPNGKIVYVAYNSGQVLPYSIGNDGRLTLIFDVGIAGSSPYAVKIDPAGKFAYAVNAGSSNISCFTINGSGGLGGDYASVTIPTSGNPLSITIDPSGKFAYCLNYGSSSVEPLQAYTINTDGSFTANANGSAFGIKEMGYYSIAADPSGKFIYITNGLNNYISAFSTKADGTLTEISGTFSTGNRPAWITVDPSGKFVYTTNRTDNTISAFSIDSATGALTGLGTFGTGTHPVSIATVRK